MNVIGIDPGVKGAIVVIDADGKILHSYVMPTIAGTFDLQAFVKIIETHKENSIAYIEDVHTLFGMSAKSNFSFGGIVWTMRAVCASFYIPYVLVAPKTWQKVMFRGVPEIRKPSKQITKLDKKTGIGTAYSKKGAVDTKAMALISAKRLYPKNNFFATNRSTTPHDGLVDATLIARYRIEDKK